MTWVERPVGLIKRGSKEQAQKERLQKKGRKCFARANICNRSKSLLDKSY
jgi:hypothetical protein